MRSPRIVKGPGTGLKTRILVYIFLSLFLIASASASVNLTISSSNNKTIQVKYLLDQSLINTTINNNPQPLLLPYGNMIIEIKTNTSSLGLNGILSNMTEVQKDFIFLIGMIAVIMVLYFGVKLLKSMGGKRGH